jgi:phosphate transport system substrate-binding protein
MKLPSCTPIGCLLVAGTTLIVFTGCSPGGSQQGDPRTVIQNKGSDTMVNLAQAWAEEYAKVATNVAVEVSGGGSGVGIAALLKGMVDVANASRDLKPEEMEQARKNTGKVPKEITIGYDALAVYVHKNNPLREISLEQLARIFAEGGDITRWSQLDVTLPGIPDDTIVRVSRQSSSGTYEFFREHVLLKRDFKLGARDMNGSKEVVELVGNTPTAIGYSGMGYATAAVRMLPVSARAGEPAVPPTVENTLTRKYPIARSLHLYTLGEPEGVVRDYIQWILSDAGQRIVQASGYVPLSTQAPKP